MANSKPKHYVVIPARGNSKGIPRKNLYQVAGKPLLYYTIKAALDSGIFDKIVVSSESDEILSYASEMGVTPAKRPQALSGDHVHAVYVILDYIKSQHLLPNTLISMLLPTSPLRRALDIKEAFKKYKASQADSLISVYGFNKQIVRFKQTNSLGYLEQLFDGNPNVQRQEQKPVYFVNGSIYFSTARTLLKHKSFHLGKVIPFIMDEQLSIDVDTLNDIKEVERRIKTCA